VSPREPDENTGKIDVTIPPTSRGILDLIGSPKKSQREGIREALRIPSCKIAGFVVKSHYSVLDLRLTPQLHVTGDNTDHVIQPAFLITDDIIELNTPFNFTGKVFPSPKNQQAVLLLHTIEKAEDSLSAYSPTESELAAFRIFQPDEWTVAGLQRKLDEIHGDLESNVTRIYSRRNLHLAIDLSFHSCLYFMFDGRQQKGWTNTLIIGDSSQGKSEASLRLSEHYGLGVRHDCKNATTAGLLGGLQQMVNRWMVTWGIIPTHDRRLVVMEEIKDTPPEVLSRLTDMRSSGIAELTMIEKRKAHARTRLIMISNPRSSRPISAYNFGVEAIKELIPGLEDIRRFDMATILSAEQVDPALINRLVDAEAAVQHVYTADLCKKLVLWAWTRDVTQIRFAPGAEEACLKYAIQMCDQFSEMMPLCDRGTMRHKLARLAISLAIRTYSVGKDPNVVLVRPCHIEYIAKFLTAEYSTPVFGYDDFSKAQVFANRLLNADLVKRQLKNTKYPKDLVEHLLHSDEITLIDLCDWCEIDRDIGQQLLSFLVRKHALYRTRRWYVKTSQFIQHLKAMQAEGLENKATPLDKEEF
jgi:hypothetical protein